MDEYSQLTPISGGPGGSGVQTVLQAAPLLQSLLGSHYDLVGFDPRGSLAVILS